MSYLRCKSGGSEPCPSYQCIWKLLYIAVLDILSILFACVLYWHASFCNSLNAAATQTLLASLESLRPKHFGISVTFGQCRMVQAALANNSEKKCYIHFVLHKIFNWDMRSHDSLQAQFLTPILDFPLAASKLCLYYYEHKYEIIRDLALVRFAGFVSLSFHF